LVLAILIVGGGIGGYFWLQKRNASADVATNTDATEATTNVTSVAAATNTKLEVKQGWNFVAFPYNTIATVADLKTKATVVTTEPQKIYRYSGQAWIDVETEGGTFKPGTGYLIYFSQTATIELGNTGAKADVPVGVPLTADTWQLVGIPTIYAIKWQETTGSTTSFTPNTGLSVELTDGAIKNLLEAIKEGYVSAPLYLKNELPNYAYTRLWEVPQTTLYPNLAFWIQSKSSKVKNLIFTTQGKASTTPVTTTEIDTGEKLTAPAVP
jgi:hypothetical protein